MISLDSHSTKRIAHLIRIPCVRFIPVEGGLRTQKFLSQEAINFLTECVWA
jgi:hypothetical protein